MKIRDNYIKNVLWIIYDYIDNVYANKYIYPKGSLIKRHCSKYNYYKELLIYDTNKLHIIKMKYHLVIVYILDRILKIRRDCIRLIMLLNKK